MAAQITTILNDVQIAEKAPAVFTKKAAPFMSDNYDFINTGSVIDIMRGEGYHVVSAQQDKPSKRDPRYVRHALVLRHQSSIGVPAKVGEHVPQILLVNSHNGRTQLSLRAGLYRFVCCNGMVVGNDAMAIAVRHAGQLALEVINHAKRIAAMTSPMMAMIENWKSIELSPAQTFDFARQAAILRFGEQHANAYKPDDLLAVKRVEDDGRALWSVFNRVQENTTQAGLHGRSATGRSVATRTLAGISANIAYNEALWALGEKTALAAA